MILSAAFLVSIALEVLLFVGQDYLLDTRRRVALEASVRQAYADLQESKKRIDIRRADLIAAMDDAEERRSNLQAANKAFDESRKVVPVLIHTIGQIDGGIHFRAPISKELPAKPDQSQQLIWTCNNFVDVGADDGADAQSLVAKQFEFKQGYDVGEFAALEPQAPAPRQETAA